MSIRSLKLLAKQKNPSGLLTFWASTIPRATSHKQNARPLRARKLAANTHLRAGRKLHQTVPPLVGSTVDVKLLY